MEAPARHGVDAALDAVKVLRGVDAEVCALADVAADETFAVLVGRPLPGRVRLGEVDLDPAQLGAWEVLQGPARQSRSSALTVRVDSTVPS